MPRRLSRRRRFIPLAVDVDVDAAATVFLLGTRHTALGHLLDECLDVVGQHEQLVTTG
jgi:hypothetical protein